MSKLKLFGKSIVVGKRNDGVQLVVVGYLDYEFSSLAVWLKLNSKDGVAPTTEDDVVGFDSLLKFSFQGSLELDRNKLAEATKLMNEEQSKS